MLEKVADICRAAGFRYTSIGALILSAVVMAAAEALSIGLTYPALAYLDKGPVRYLDVLPTPMRSLVDVMKLAGIEVGLGALLAVALVPVVVLLALRLVVGSLVTSLTQKAIANLRLLIFTRAIEANTKFHKSNPAARLHMAIVGQSNGVARVVPEVGMVFANALQAVFIFCILLMVSWHMTLAAATSLGLLAVIYRFLSRRGGAIAEDNVQGYLLLKARMLESMQNVRLIKLRAMESETTNRFGGELDRVFRTDFRINFYTFVIDAVALSMFSVVALLLFYVGATWFEITLAALGLFTVMLLRLQPAVGAIGRSTFAIATGLEAWTALDGLLREAEAAREDYEGRVRFSTLGRSIEFDNVHFSHRGDGRIVAALKDVTFAIDKGQFVGIVGKSGVGKSTLLDLIPRFIRPDSGHVRLDGVDLADFDLKSLRRGIGLVPQEASMFDDTIRTNLTYGIEGPVADADLIHALEAANATDILVSMPRGLDTKIGERGGRLSGGQRQRLALARAVLAGQSILLLDEPTNALDAQSEASIRQTLLKLKGHVTIIIVAHRLETLEIADRILVMRDGNVIDDGSHRKLLVHSTYYRELFNLQAAS